MSRCGWLSEERRDVEIVMQIMGVGVKMCERADCLDGNASVHCSRLILDRDARGDRLKHD